MNPRSNLEPIAGAAWLSAAVIYVALEAVAASRFSPAYDYRRNLISELGVVECGPALHGPPICSPLHDVMNVGFIAEGVLFIFALALVFKQMRGVHRSAFAALGFTHGLGLILVGLFHVGEADRADGTIIYHLIGAMLAIVAGNLAIAVSPLAIELEAPSPIRVFGRIAGAFGLVAVVVLGVNVVRHTSFGYGLWERFSVYSILAWEIVTGIWLMADSARVQGRRVLASVRPNKPWC